VDEVLGDRLPAERSADHRLKVVQERRLENKMRAVLAHAAQLRCVFQTSGRAPENSICHTIAMK
jgi:hypothetical protein